MNVEIGAEAALFPEKEYRKGIFVTVHLPQQVHYIRVGSLLSSEQDVITCPPEIASQPAPPLPLPCSSAPLWGEV